MNFFKQSSGKAPVSLFLLGLVVIAGLTLAISNPPVSTPNPTTNNAGFCCDSGDGAACHPLTGAGQTLTYNGQQYGLIKSNISLEEGSGHIQKTDTQVDATHWVYINTSDHTASPQECGHNQDDQVWGDGGCVAIPNDIVVYVCEKNCDQAGNIFPGQNNPDTPVFDAYFRLADQANIPDVIKNCDKNISTDSDPKSVGQVLVLPSGESERTNLHLNTFTVQNPPYTPWLSPYCKPAIYLYPPNREPVTVQIHPQGTLTYTLPTYPQNGWNVIANPDGVINYGSSTYDYLYYEDELPDTSYSAPKDGYTVAYSNLSSFLPSLLEKLGLNSKERGQFDEYWLKVLPKSNYYFIGILPQTVLNNISPLTVSPTPQSVIRITLYFNPLDQNQTVQPPAIQSVERRGFTVVEWGGIVKRHKDKPFSCYM